MTSLMKPCSACEQARALQAMPRVGVAVLVCHGDRLLMGQRIGAHGAGTWSVPGGHVESTDASIRLAAARELAEETGIVVGAESLRVLPDTTITTFPGDPPRTYVTIYAFIRAVRQPLARAMEPTKCAEWRWARRDDIPRSEMFEPLRKLIDGGCVPWQLR